MSWSKRIQKNEVRGYFCDVRGDKAQSKVSASDWPEKTAEREKHAICNEILEVVAKALSRN